MKNKIKLLIFSELIFIGALLSTNNTSALELHDTSSPEVYTEQVMGVCTDVDNQYGSQCVDLFSDFHYNHTGRWLSTAGTGAAYGLWDVPEYNAGDDYQLITDPADLQAGDWVIFYGGEFGHVGMAVGGSTNGTVPLLGENQGGTPCPGGGSAANIIDMSTQNFRGAFRPNEYVEPTPAPVPTPEPTPESGEEPEEEVIEVEVKEEKKSVIDLFEPTATLNVFSLVK